MKASSFFLMVFCHPWYCLASVSTIDTMAIFDNWTLIIICILVAAYKNLPFVWFVRNKFHGALI